MTSNINQDELRKLAEAAAKDGLSIATHGSPGEVALQIAFNSARAGILSQADEIARLRKSVAMEWTAYMDDAVSRAPEPLRQLGEYLAGLLDEDQWKTAERYLNAAALSPPHADREVQND